MNIFAVRSLEEGVDAVALEEGDEHEAAGDLLVVQQERPREGQGGGVARQPRKSAIFQESRCIFGCCLEKSQAVKVNYMGAANR